MAVRQNLKNVVQAMSIADVALLTYLDDGALFRKFPSDTTPPIIPTRQKVADPMVGDGRPYPKKGKPYRFDPRNIPYNGALNSTAAVRVIRQALGGTVSDTINTTPNLTTDSLIHIKAAGSVPRLSNVLRELGGESLLHGDVWVESFEASQQGDGEPRITSTMRNTGHFKKLSATAIDTADIEDMATYLKFHGAKTVLTFSDGVGTYNFGNEGRLIDVSFNYNQNVIVEGMIGDPFVDTANECQGAYSKNANIDVQSASMKGKVYMGTDFTNFDAWVADRTITSASLTFKSCEIIVGTHLFEIEFKIPIGEMLLTPDTQGNFSAFSFQIDATDGDPVTGDIAQVRIRHLTSQDIEDIL